MTKLLKKLACLVLLVLLTVLVLTNSQSLPAFAAGGFDGLLPAGVPMEMGGFSGLMDRAGTKEMKFSLSGHDFPDYNLAQMRAINSDFTAHPDTDGIIWLKQNHFSRSSEGGVNRETLWVILGRDGLASKWLTWNIPSPSDGSTEVVEASVYSLATLACLSEVMPAFDPGANLYTVDFTPHVKNLGQDFILVLAWREHMPRKLAFENFVWFQEELPVWEAVAELRMPQGNTDEIFWRSRPLEEPEIVNHAHEVFYTWRAMNLDPLRPDSLTDDSSQRAGVSFSTRNEAVGLTVMMRDTENLSVPNMPDEAAARFKKSGALGLLSWLYNQPGIVLTEGSSRTIPDTAPWTRWEKVVMARKWLQTRGVDTSLRWRLPIEPSGAGPSNSIPVCQELLQDVLIEILPKNTQKSQKSSEGKTEIGYYDLRETPMPGAISSTLAGVQVFGVADNGRLIRKQISGSSSNANRLSAIMRLRMLDQGMLNGEVRLMLRGAWATFLSLPSDTSKATDEQMRAALLRLFPGLTNYNTVKYRKVKGVPELSFAIQNKSGVRSVGGENILLLPPVFEPSALRTLTNAQKLSEQIYLRFPFILEQDLEIELSKNVDRVLVSGKINRVPGKINYSEEYKTRRDRITAVSRLEVGLTQLTGDDIRLLGQNAERWRVFVTKQLPVQIKKR